MDLVVLVYQSTKGFPEDERFGLTSQVRRAAVSMPANIAEGHDRTHRGDHLHHLSMVRGSLAEVETHLTVAVRLDFMTREEAMGVWTLCQEVGKMLNGLIASLRKGPNPQPSTPDL
jgi:four helix bundle protein